MPFFSYHSLGHTSFNWFRWIFIISGFSSTTNHASIFTTIFKCNTKYAYSTDINQSWAGILIIWCNRSIHIHIYVYWPSFPSYYYQVGKMSTKPTIYVPSYISNEQYSLLSHFYSLSPCLFDGSLVERQTSRETLDCSVRLWGRPKKQHIYTHRIETREKKKKKKKERKLITE